MRGGMDGGEKDAVNAGERQREMRDANSDAGQLCVHARNRFICEQIFLRN
jgi:hypothetical protein